MFILNNLYAQKDTILNDSITVKFIKKPDENTKINDIFLYYGWIDYSFEHYKVDSKNSFIDHHMVYQPYLGKKHTFQIEMGLVHASIESGQYYSPGDLSISYQRIIASKNYNLKGYQGIGLIMKFTVPTGSDEYFSGFDSWTIEPQIGTQWRFTNPNWLTAISIRYNYSFAALPGSSPRFSYFRMEYFFGYENKNWWGFIEPDYRFIPTRNSHNLFIGFNAGYKISRKFAVHAKLKPRIIGSDFYESFYSFGGTWYM